jgi:hypothetical protein
MQKRLAMSDLFMIPLAPAVLDRVDLLALNGPDYITNDCRPRHKRRTDFGVAFSADQQNAVKGDGLFFGRFPVDANDIASGDLMLPAAVVDNCVHLSETPRKKPEGELWVSRGGCQVSC